VLWERLRRHEELVGVQDMARHFAALVHKQRVDDLDPWLAECRTGPALALWNDGAGRPGGRRHTGGGDAPLVYRPRRGPHQQSSR